MQKCQAPKRMFRPKTDKLTPRSFTIGSHFVLKKVSLLSTHGDDRGVCSLQFIGKRRYHHERKRSYENIVSDAEARLRRLRRGLRPVRVADLRAAAGKGAALCAVRRVFPGPQPQRARAAEGKAQRDRPGA